MHAAKEITVIFAVNKRHNSQTHAQCAYNIFVCSRIEMNSFENVCVFSLLTLIHFRWLLELCE